MELDRELLNKLVVLRDQIKEKEKKSTGRTPVVCSDEALELIAKYRPRIPGEFECIPGLGKAFIDKYGQKFGDTVVKYSDKGFTTKMSGHVSKTLKELEKNLITLNKKNRLLFSSQLRPKDGFDLFQEQAEEVVKMLFGKKQKIVIKNDEGKSWNDEVRTGRKPASHYKKITAMLREVNRDLRDKGQNNLYIAYPFAKGKMMGDDFNVRAPLVFFPVKAEKNSLQITLSQDNSRDIIFNNALVLANYKFNKIKKPLPNPVLEEDAKTQGELFTALENFYRENEILLKRDEERHNPKAITIEEDFSIQEFEEYKNDGFPEYKKGEIYIEEVMVLGRYLICDSTIQRDFDALLELNQSTVQMDKLLTAFGLEEDAVEGTEVPNKDGTVKENDLVYINSLNGSQEEVLNAMGKMDQLVIQGPPGTGKSQTITSLIVDSILKDKTVLLVSEKKTALDVVYSRLGTLSKYALLIDDVGNKTDFYKQISAMVMTALDTSGEVENLEVFSNEVEANFAKLKTIADRVYNGKAIGTDIINLYQNSKRVDLKASVEFNKCLKIENYKKSCLLKYSFDTLNKAKEKFLDNGFNDKIALFCRLRDENPWLLSLKDDLAEFDVMKIKAEIQNQYGKIEALKAETFINQLFKAVKIKKTLKDILKNKTAKNKGRFIKASIENPDEVMKTLDIYSDYIEAKKAYETLSKEEINYLNVMLLLQMDNKELDLCAVNRDLFNTILVIHIGKFESKNHDVLADINNYRDIIRGITNSMSDKRRSVIQNASLKLAGYMDGLTNAKRKNEIARALESSRKMSVTKFLTKFKMEVFDSVKIWMMTPEVVSELIPLQQGIFDLVIFDEASQMFVEKGIPSIFRAKKVVIAGDSKQLRPTKLFMGRFEDNPEDMDGTEETNEALEEQSLLDLARYKYDNVMLKYHYRSKFEELIAFSNHAFYKGQLVVSPNPINGEKPPIEVHKVENGTWINTANKKEAEYCVQLVKKILKERKNNETIGIITFNSHQHDLIEDCLDYECIQDKDFETALAFERNRKENGEDISLFVKNIENVQGDERDIIIFSVGFAKNEEGKMYRNYGWLNNEGGENRLNVAISRAKAKIHIVTSVHPAELVVDDLKHEGPKYLKKYLEYCFAVDSGNVEMAKMILNGLSNKAETITEAENSIFKMEVYEELRKKGFEVDLDVGIGGYSIDLAIRKGNDYVLGIECDSSLYKKNSETRERDYHRQKFLESRGWTVCRLWSSSWWNDKNQEIEKIKELVD